MHTRFLVGFISRSSVSNIRVIPVIRRRFRFPLASLKQGPHRSGDKRDSLQEKRNFKRRLSPSESARVAAAGLPVQRTLVQVYVSETTI
jgi:hypothetical protein